MHIANAISGGRVRKQIKRAIPIYVACVLLFLLFAQTDHFEKYQHTPGVVLRRILAYKSSPHRRDTKFPKKIWQSWKVDPLDMDERDSGRARTWTKMNPGYRYEVLTDGNDLDYVETHWGPDGENRPDIVEVYRSLNAQIIKADLLRYLVMYLEGGVYADIDVEALRPINTWIPSDFEERDVDFIVSVEIDEPSYVNHTILGQKSESFCQWTFMLKPRVPVMMKLIEHVLHWLNEVAQNQQVPISNVTLNFDEVITGTGPSAFTAAVMTEMTRQTHQKMHWDTFHNMSEPILVGNVLVLTVEAFAAGQGHSNSGNHESEKALVKHHYHASKWPSRHPRYSHPAYGMVEECNWARDCVEKWDEGVALFDFLPEEEKQKRIAEHDVWLKEKDEKEAAEEAEREKEDKERKLADLKGQCESAGFITASPTAAASASRTGTEASPTAKPEEAQGDAKPDEPKKDENKEEPKKEEPKKEEVKKEEPEKEEPKKEEKAKGS